jgi:hypothetical protein
MFRRKFFSLGAILAGVVIAGLAPPAQADFVVQFSYNGAQIKIDGTTGTVTTSGGASVSGASIDTSTAGSIGINNLTVSTSGTTGGFKISATIADSNSPGTPDAATIDLSSLRIKNQNSGAGSGTLTVTTGDTGFTAPVGQVNLTSTMSATASGLNAQNASVTFNSCLDQTNTQFGTSGSGVTGTPTINFTVAPGNSGPPNPPGPNSYAVLTVSQTPYSLTQVAQFTLANGDVLTDGSSGTTVTSPAPAGLVLALTGLPCLLLGRWLRRREPQTA